MAQVSMTVRMDAQLKSRFDSLCSQFGMSANTAINIFANAVVNTQSIPFEITIPKRTPSAYEKGLEAFRALREEARQNGLQDMSLEEINEEIRQIRQERAAREKEVAKEP